MVFDSFIKYLIGNHKQRLRAASILATLCWSALCIALEPGQFYRYLNEEGVKVISHSIPPEYSQKGYEIISKSGQVLKVVPPAMDPEKVKAEEIKRAEERALLAEFDILARRYSSEKEIYAARDRRLAHLNANIAILNSNINSLQNQINDLMTKAASYERGGRKAPAMILQSLEETRAEKASTEEMLSSRTSEHEKIYAEFEASAALYKKGYEIMNQKREELRRQSKNEP